MILECEFCGTTREFPDDKANKALRKAQKRALARGVNRVITICEACNRKYPDAVAGSGPVLRPETRR